METSASFEARSAPSSYSPETSPTYCPHCARRALNSSWWVLTPWRRTACLAPLATSIILVRPTAENAARVMQALQAFGAPLFDLQIGDLLRDDTVFQMGLPPARIDILTGISGVSFASTVT